MGSWHPIADAPFGRDLEVAVLEKQEYCSLVVPCRRDGPGWQDGRGRPIDINPTHWRDWLEEEHAATPGLPAGRA